MTVTRRSVLAVPGLAAAGSLLGSGRLGILHSAVAATAAKSPVSFDIFSLKINGKRVYHWSGEFHYWRIPSPDLWRDVLQKYKAGGFTAASIYFNWAYHSSAPGVYDFTGVRDITALLEIASEVGIHIVARPGPYINAETDSGGFPGWVDTQLGRARSAAPDYLAAALEWLTNVNAILSKYQIASGGPIILYQIENEYTQGDLVPAYMEALEAKARADGITVPLFHNDAYTADNWQPGTPGGTNIYAFDSYPQGFNASTPTVWNQVPDFAYVRNDGAQLNPIFIAEAQGGSFDPWGGPGYAACRALTDANFNRIFYKNNVASGATMQSFYMLFGGTSWGWLPEPSVYSSYDYGAAITEGRQLTSKYAENRKIGLFLNSVKDILQTAQLSDAKSTNTNIRVRHMANPSTLTQFFTILHSDSTSTKYDTVNFQLSLADQNYQSVPQVGSLIINGRDAKLLVAGYKMNSQSLMYSTSEIMTHFHAGQQDAALFYGRPGEPGETVMRYSAEPFVANLIGSVSSTYDASTGDLRLNYTHNGLIIVSILGGGVPLLLAIADDNAAATFWRFDVGTTPVLIQGPELVRTVAISGNTIEVTGDSSAATSIAVFTAPSVHKINWNGAPIASFVFPYGSVVGSIPGPKPVTLPMLTGWVSQYETPEAQPGFDDGAWAVAANTTTNNPTKPAAGEAVLYADDYGFHHGDVWYRARFTATGSESGVALSAISPYPGRVAVWINGQYAGDNLGNGNTQTFTFSFPAGSLIARGINVISALIEDFGHNEDFSSTDSHKQPRGLVGYALQGSSVALTWKVQGNQGGQTPIDTVRGPFNNGGLFGDRNGWYLPGYPTTGWSATSLPATNSKPGITWYRTTVALELPVGQDVSVGLQVADDKSRDYHLRIFVNGWHMGLYVNNVGPQTTFVVPNGILNTNGENTIAVACWSFGDGMGGLGELSLAVLGNVAGGVPVSLVDSPSYQTIFG